MTVMKEFGYFCFVDTQLCKVLSCVVQNALCTIDIKFQTPLKAASILDASIQVIDVFGTVELTVE